MPRRGGVPKRDVLPDPVYNSKVVTKLINQIMYDGKRGTAQNIVYGAFDIMSNKLGKDAMEIFEQAIQQIVVAGHMACRQMELLGGGSKQ